MLKPDLDPDLDHLVANQADYVATIAMTLILIAQTLRGIERQLELLPKQDGMGL